MSTFDYTFTDQAGDSATIILGVYGPVTGGTGQVTSISGTFNGIAITGLSSTANNIVSLDTQASTITYSGSDNLAFTLADGSAVELTNLLGTQGAFVQAPGGNETFSGFTSQSVAIVTSKESVVFTDSSGAAANMIVTVSGGVVIAISGTYNGSAITGIDGNMLSVWNFPYDSVTLPNSMVLTFDTASGDQVSAVYTAGGHMNDVTVVNSARYSNDYTVTSLTETALCFCEGTRIATPKGEVAVEVLRAGDLVLTAEGAARPVRWLGRSDVSALFADPLRAAPIRITAGAFGENLPARDLRVSPDHALFLKGVLVQAAALVNGVSIFREPITEDFSYYHVELDSHDLLISEGLATESFVDNVDRMVFSNWDERTTPATPIAELPYPRVKSARQLPRALREMVMLRPARAA